MKRLILFGFFCCLSALAVDVPITMHPQQSVVGAGTVTVSLGVPIPPGVLTSVTNVQVINASSAEVTAHVEQIMPWQAIPPTALLCKNLPVPGSPGIRSVLVQFSNSFTSITPVTGWLVRLGTARTLDNPTLTSVDSTYQQAADGTYAGCQDFSATPRNECTEVREPKVYVTMTPRWLSCSGLIPVGTISGEHASLVDMDSGYTNFWKSLLDQYPVTSSSLDWVELFPTASSCSGAVGYSDWEYDRAGLFYNLYISTGSLAYLREAHRLTKHYMSLIYRAGECLPDQPDGNCRGIFSLMAGPACSFKDDKYSYSEPVIILSLLTGDAAVSARIADLKNFSWNPDNSNASDIASFTINKAQTERHVAWTYLRLLADYELNGTALTLTRLNSSITALNSYINAPDSFPNRRHYRLTSISPIGAWAFGLTLTGSSSGCVGTFVDRTGRNNHDVLEIDITNAINCTTADTITGTGVSASVSAVLADYNAVNGCFNYYLYGVGNKPYGFDTWKSAILAKALLRVYYITGNSTIPTILTNLVNCLNTKGICFCEVADACVNFAANCSGASCKLACYTYVSRAGGSLAPNDTMHESDLPTGGSEHAIDPANALAIGILMTSSQAQKDTWRAAITDLLRTQKLDEDYWTRPTGYPGNGRTLYRTTPARKFGWWYHGYNVIGWALDGATSYTTP